MTATEVYELITPSLAEKSIEGQITSTKALIALLENDLEELEGIEDASGYLVF